MLRSGRDVEAFERIGIGFVVDIVRIVIIDNRMGHIDIDPPNGVDDLDKAIQADPGVVVEGGLPLDMVDNSTSPCERRSGWIFVIGQT